MFVELNPHLNNKIAVVVISASILESIINVGTGNAVAIHGVRNVKILDTVFCSMGSEVWLIVISDDIPAYVAYNKMIGKLRYKIIEYDVHGSFEYPELICVMRAECSCMEDRELNECEDDYEDEWWR